VTGPSEPEWPDGNFAIDAATDTDALAASKHLAWLSMWSPPDTQCPGGRSRSRTDMQWVVQGADPFAKHSARIDSYWRRRMG